MPLSYRAWLLACAVLSGATSLVYEVVWLRAVGILYGQTLAAVGIILAVFMAGLAVGSYWLGKRVDRSATPLRLYGSVELGIAATAAVVPYTLIQVERLSVLFAGFSRDHLAGLTLLWVQVPLSVWVLLPPTVLIGGTLPILGRLLTESERPGTPAVLYGSATAGAVAGAILSAFVLIPLLGNQSTNIAAVIVNGLLGVVCLILKQPGAAAPSAAGVSTTVQSANRPAARGIALRPSPSQLYLVVGASGCAALIYEVVWTRLLSLVLENTVYAFSLMLGTFLAGLALGSFCVARFLKPDRSVPLLLGWTQCGVALSSLAMLVVLPTWAELFYRTYLGGSFGDSWLMHIITQELVCSGLMLLPAALLGTTLPIAWRIGVANPSRLGSSMGKLLGANTLGAIIGSLGASFVLIPVCGLRTSLLLASLVNATVGATILLRTPSRNRGQLLFAGGLLALLGYGTLNTDVTFQSLAASDNRHILYHREDGSGVVEVVEDRATGVRALLANRLRKEGADGPDDVFVARLQGYLPLLLHPRPERMAIVGLGTGTSLAAVLLDNVHEATVVELSAGVVEAAEYFSRSNRRVLDDSKVSLRVDDGRSFFRQTPHRYDVIVQDLFFPYRTGTGNLYTLEHYRRLDACLRTGGVAVQWLSLNQLGSAPLRVISRTFQAVFPNTSIWLVGGYVALVGSASPLTIDAIRLEADFDRALEQDSTLASLTAVDVLTAFVMGTDQVSDWVAGAPLNTEDNGWIEYRSPFPFHLLYGKTDLAATALQCLLDRREIILPFVTNLPADMRERLERAHQARTLAFTGLLLRHQGREAQARDYYRRAYRLQPTDPFALHHMRAEWLEAAVGLLRDGNLNEARRLALRVLGNTPRSLTARFILAHTYLAQGEGQRALTQLRRIEDVAPAFPDLQVALQHARRLTIRWVWEGRTSRATVPKQGIQRVGTARGETSI